MTPWLLVPVKSFAAGKSRLTPFLRHGTRRQLNEFFLYRVIETATTRPKCAKCDPDPSAIAGTDPESIER